MSVTIGIHMTWVAFAAGLLVLVLLVRDVHTTVFVPRGSGGVVSRRIYRWSWNAWRRIGNRFRGARRRMWLAKLGPVLIPLTITGWGAMLMLSFALMLVPWVHDFTVSPAGSGPIPDWAMTIYYSGYSASTLGIGDVTPNDVTPRIMAIAEASLGFGLFTVSVTYLLAVYSARSAGCSLALAISRYIGRREGHDPVALLVTIASWDKDADSNAWLSRIAFDLASLVELRGQYPLLHYFHEPNDDLVMPIALPDLLQVVTLCRTMLDPEEFPHLATGPTTKAIERLGVQYFAGSLAASLGQANDEQDEPRRLRYEQARQRLDRSGVALRDDHDAWERYRAISRQWDTASEQMRDWLGY